MADSCFNSLVEKPVPVGQLPGGLVLEEKKTIPEPDWNSTLILFEHINSESAGRVPYDPGKSAHSDIT